MRIERVHIAVFVAIGALVWWITLGLQGTSVTLKHATPFTVVVGALGALGFVLEHYLWRCRALRGWFVRRPDIRGTWRVELQSSYVKPESGERVPVMVCYMGVKQTLSELKMHLMTPDSESWAIAAHAQPSPSGSGYQVVCVYNNRPSVHLRNERTSEIHNGALVIETHGPDTRPDSLTAEYWTDRKTAGTMRFTDRVTETFTRFEDAKHHFER